MAIPLPWPESRWSLTASAGFFLIFYPASWQLTSARVRFSSPPQSSPSRPALLGTFFSTPCRYSYASGLFSDLLRPCSHSLSEKSASINPLRSARDGCRDKWLRLWASASHSDRFWAASSASRSGQMDFFFFIPCLHSSVCFL